MIYRNTKFWIFVAIILLIIVAVLFGAVFIGDNSLSDSDIVNAKDEIYKRAISEDIKSKYKVTDNLETVDISQLKEITKKIIQSEDFDEKAVKKLLEIIDKALISNDINKIKFSLKILFELYFFNEKNENNFNDIVRSDPYRKNIIIGLLESNNEFIRRNSYSILAMYFLDEEYVVPSLLNLAATPVKEEGFEKLHYIRTLGHALNDDRTLIRDFLVEEVLKAKTASNFNANTVDAVHSLSELLTPPEQIILPTIEMLEGRYFGDPLLLESIRNYGILMRPYLTRLKELEVEVNERIVSGRDQKGKGSSTFTKSQYRKVLEELEKL